MSTSEPLLPPHGGYRNLKSFQVAQLIYDITARFCNLYIARHSRTHDQMVQAARSGVQNIAEGSQASGTSKRTELKLTNVARASLQELRLDYEDFLRQNSLPLWNHNDPRRQALIDRRCATTDAFAAWSKDMHECGHGERPGYPEIAANGALVLLAVVHPLLGRQLEAQARAFERDGGFSERLYRVRCQNRAGLSSGS